MKPDSMPRAINESPRITKSEEFPPGKNSREELEREIEEIKAKMASLRKKVAQVHDSLDQGEQPGKETGSTSAQEIPAVVEVTETQIETLVQETETAIEDKNDKLIEKFIETEMVRAPASPSTRKLELPRKKSGKWRKRLIKYILLPIGLATGAVTVSKETPQEYWGMFNNWKERHLDKFKVDDPSIIGMNSLYNDSTNNAERSTYDYIGKDRIDYKEGYYMSTVFDLTDRTPPQFKVINSRQFYSNIDSASGITTNLFKKFYRHNEFVPQLKGHKDKFPLEISEIPVIAYNEKTRTIKAGHFKEFNNDWMVSETYEIPLNFKLNPDSTINLIYHDKAMRMVPQSINEKGNPIPFPIGITFDKKITKINPREATHFGTLEGGKVIIVCGNKQLQVNGSFADIFRVYERLRKEQGGAPIQAYLLDNGSYNLPIWNKNQDSVLTKGQIVKHMLRNADGGTALVLVSNGSISPYEYRNRYPEIYHQIAGATLDSITKKPAINEKLVIVIHHTGNYADPNQIIKEFSDTTKERSAHVLILKDGTRHIFNNDNAVLGHAGKSEFNGRNKVNYFSLGIELEGDSKNGHQFTVAQLESMLEYMRPRVEKYSIPLENITTHKIIRENYIKDHPNEKGVPKKVDLDDTVWAQIRILIAKKLYSQPKPISKLDIEAHHMLATLTYQEAYRLTRNKDFSLNQAKLILAENGVEQKDIDQTGTWITKKVS